jgi:hypothetical protein
MSFDKKYIQQSKSSYGSKELNEQEPIRTIYFAAVVSIDDKLDGGRIRVRIPDIDNDITDGNLSFCYPILPKFFWNYPKVGEVVRIFIEDTRYPQKGRHWMGSVISQPQKIKKDDQLTALSTTGLKTQPAEQSISTQPEAIGVFPDLDDIGIVGRDNVDLILRERELELRVGKHLFNNVLKINRKNPATLRMNFEDEGSRSSAILQADKIALLSHAGNPKFKVLDMDVKERDRIFKEAHPAVFGDILSEILKVYRRAILTHLHGYSGIPADKSNAISDLEKLNIDSMLSDNIVIN